MDYVAHGFWSYIFFNWVRRPLYAVLFGLLPDTSSWLIYTIYRMWMGGEFSKPILSIVPDWVFTLYNISHSLFVAAAAILIVSLILRRIPMCMLAWPAMIVLDVFTHTRDFLPTPFLWPISEWRFPGISWGTWQFMVINYSVIAICLFAIIVYRKRRSSDK